MPELTPVQRRALRARAHNLNPVVSVSQQGLSDTVLAEIERSLAAHELIKVRVYGAEREDREALLVEICRRLEAAPVQHIGNILVVFREKPAEPKPAPAHQPAPNRRPKPAVPAKSAAAPRRRLRKA